MRLRLRHPGIARSLLLLLLATLALVVAGNWWIEGRLESDLLAKIDARREALAVALQVSLQELDSTSEHSADLLDDYVRRLSEHGVHRIAILGAGREELASASAPGRPPTAPLASAHLGSTDVAAPAAGDAASQPKDEPSDWALDLPVLVDEQVRGYVHLSVGNQDLRDLIHASARKRDLLALAALLAGMGGVTLISLWWTRDLDELSLAASQVAAGDLSAELHSGRRDELGVVVRTFDDMLRSLRERRELEEGLHRAERQATAGLLAASVVHELGNPLNYISLSVDHLARELAPSEPARAAEFAQIASSLRQEIGRMERLLQAYRRQGEPLGRARGPCPVEACVGDVLTLVAARARQQGVVVERELDQELPPLWADPAALRTCLLNLVSNALQAMPDGGRLGVEARVAGEGGDRKVLLRVRDTGRGIPPQARARLFDAYYTTREDGLGLGLSIADRIVRQHGGRLRVESEPGRGSCFEIELPILEPGEPGATSEPGSAA